MALSLLLMADVGCSTLPVTPVDHAHFRDLGEVEGEALNRAISTVLVEERGFTLARQTHQLSSLYVETAWKERTTFAAEEERGVRHARSRLLIRGHRSSGGAFRITLEAENQVRTDSIPSWHSVSVGPGFRDWVDGIVGELRESASPG